MGTVSINPAVAGAAAKPQGSLSANGSVQGSTANTVPVTLVAAPGANARLNVTQVTVSNSNTSAGTEVTLKDGVTGRWTIPAPAGVQGHSVQFDPPLRLTANGALNFTTGANGPVVTVSANGFKEGG